MTPTQKREAERFLPVSCLEEAVAEMERRAGEHKSAADRRHGDEWMADADLACATSYESAANYLRNLYESESPDE